MEVDGERWIEQQHGALFQQAARQHGQKLWYQLSRTLRAIIDSHPTASLQLDLWRFFIVDFAKQLDPLALVALAVRIAPRHETLEESLAFLDSVDDRLDAEKAPEARALAHIEAAAYRLQLGRLEEAQATISESTRVLESLPGADTSVHAALYRVSGDYHKARAEYADFYKTSLLYLACINVTTDLSATDRVERAHDLSLSALLGDTIYNFGELLMHPILDALIGTPHEWLRSLLLAFNDGAIGKFESLAPLLPRAPILLESQAFLRQKICLMALIAAVSTRPAGARVIRFDVVAQETHLPEEEVEHLLMKALSCVQTHSKLMRRLGLIRGLIDEVVRTVNVSWVQPRVLAKPQIADLQQRIDSWTARVRDTSVFARSVAPELLV